MTEKDYIIIARAIAEANSGNCPLQQEAYNLGVYMTADRICEALQADNADFDKVKFIAHIDKHTAAKVQQ